MGEDVLLGLSHIRCGFDSNRDAVAWTLVGGAFTVAYRWHGQGAKRRSCWQPAWEEPRGIRCAAEDRLPP